MENLEVVYIYNMEQAFFYIKHKIYPIDMGTHSDTQRFYFKFIRKDTQLCYVEWKKRNKTI